jgi:hypothetical protein
MFGIQINHPPILVPESLNSLNDLKKVYAVTIVHT